MKFVQFIAFIFLFQNCSNSKENIYKQINSMQTKKVIFETTDLTKDHINFDTFEIGKRKNTFIFKSINDFIKNEKMAIVTILTFDFENKKEQEIFLNYDLLGDSIRYLDTTYNKIGQMKSYELKDKKFEIVKQPRNIFNKTSKPNGYDYFNKEYGILAFQRKNKNSKLVKYEKNELTNSEKLLIKLLTADKEFYTLE